MSLWTNGGCEQNKWETSMQPCSWILKTKWNSKVSRTINWVEHMRIYLFYWNFLVIFKPSFHGFWYNFCDQQKSFEILVDIVNGHPKTMSLLIWLVVILKPPLDSFDSFMANLKPLVFGQLETMQLSRSVTTSARSCFREIFSH